MVEFGNKPIEVAPAPERKKKPEPSEDTTFGGEPELSETPVIDEVQATAPVEPQTPAEAHETLKSINGVESAPPPTEPYPEPQTLKETVAKVSEPKPDIPKNPPLSKCRAKPLKKKGNRKHNKKKRRHGR